MLSALSRTADRLAHELRFLPSPLPPSTSSSSSSPSTIADGGSGGASINDGSSAYSALLRTVLFGPDCGVVSPSTPEKSPHGRGSSPLTPPRRNIFRFKTESRRPYRSISPYDFDGALPGVVSPPSKAPRKVPRSPFKVLDAPALQDDFYLNLVDWSSHNVLAVGLRNCVYLWNACSSKVTKLCDLGVGDSVCSVGWAQCGTHLVVGTNNGKVEVRDMLGHGRLIKRQIVDGKGDFPMDCLLHDSLLRVHYKGTLLSEEKTVFYETRVDNNGEPLEFSSGEGLFCYFSSSRPENVSEGAYVQWEIELLGFEMPKENRLFKDGKFKLAKAKFSVNIIT
ncbi:Protein FIZZY-RELATED 2 [Acorus calamus]|uniref:Protein FIZZY-RELATED 2 n=1 Tax=Acorus calamus TaxID=4465 RepID=A0AAV9C5B6_ACOCL|nr:Protein FIZZY-RELATED 2 [Acorus calamus]